MRDLLEENRTWRVFASYDAINIMQAVVRKTTLKFGTHSNHTYLEGSKRGRDRGEMFRMKVMLSLKRTGRTKF